MNIKEIKEAIATEQISPSKLFSVEDIMKDTEVTVAVKKAKTNLYDQNQRLQGEVDTLKDKQVSVTESYEAKLSQARAETLKGRAGTVLEKVATGRKLSDQERKYVELDLAHFTTEAKDEAGMEEDMKKFVDKSLDDMAAKAELLGVKLEKKDEEGKRTEEKSEKKEEKSKFDEDNPADTIPDDENEFIPGSKADLELQKG